MKDLEGGAKASGAPIWADVKLYIESSSWTSRIKLQSPLFCSYAPTGDSTLKVAKMREAIMEDQDELLMRSSRHTEVGLENNDAALLEDVAQNADLYMYIANQDAKHMQT